VWCFYINVFFQKNKTKNEEMENTEREEGEEIESSTKDDGMCM
jgi:hypothetical protein